MTNVQIRDVPDDVHRRLKSQAAMSGQSLGDFLRDRISEIALLPTIPEMTARIRDRGPYTGPTSAAMVREGRAQRG